jgi:hypothetical protein
VLGLSRSVSAPRAGDGPLSVRARPSSLKRDYDRRATSTGGKYLVNVHAKSRLIPEPLQALRPETKGQAGACPDRAGHPLYGAGGHGVPTIVRDRRRRGPLHARSAGQRRVPPVTPGQPYTPAHLRTGRPARCANRPSKQRVAGPVPLTPPCGRPCIGCWQRREPGGGPVRLALSAFRSDMPI